MKRLDLTSALLLCQSRRLVEDAVVTVTVLGGSAVGLELGSALPAGTGVGTGFGVSGFPKYQVV
jgi:hypothetical protein